MTVLAIESSAVTAGCAVSIDGRLVSEGFIDSGLTHSQTLMPLVSETLENAGISPDDIDCIAVSAGPGSFTGIRIGVGTAKGIAFTRDTPCVGVSTLAAIAYGASKLSGVICAVMDARRDQVYNALFTSDGKGYVERIIPDRAISIAELKNELSQYSETIWFCGDGAQLCFDNIKDQELNVSIAPKEYRWQCGRGVIAAAMTAINNNKTVAPDKLVPVYLRLPQAERELKKKNSGNRLEG